MTCETLLIKRGELSLAGTVARSKLQQKSKCKGSRSSSMPAALTHQDTSCPHIHAYTEPLQCHLWRHVQRRTTALCQRLAPSCDLAGPKVHGTHMQLATIGSPRGRWSFHVLAKHDVGRLHAAERSTTDSIDHTGTNQADLPRSPLSLNKVQVCCMRYITRQTRPGNTAISYLEVTIADAAAVAFHQHIQDATHDSGSLYFAEARFLL